MSWLGFGAPPEWQVRVDEARLNAERARASQLRLSPESTASKAQPSRLSSWLARAELVWSRALYDWYLDGNAKRMGKLLRDGLDWPPEMAAVCREALAHALTGDRKHLINRPSVEVLHTLLWRAQISYAIKEEMKASKPPRRRGESINEKVAVAVNKEWKEGGTDWGNIIPIIFRLPFSEGHKATERTVADDTRKFAKYLKTYANKRALSL